MKTEYTILLKEDISQRLIKIERNIDFISGLVIIILAIQITKVAVSFCNKIFGKTKIW